MEQASSATPATEEASPRTSADRLVLPQRDPQSHDLVDHAADAGSVAIRPAHRFLLFDRDAKFGSGVVRFAKEMGSKPIRTAFRNSTTEGPSCTANNCDLGRTIEGGQYTATTHIRTRREVLMNHKGMEMSPTLRP